MYNEHFGFSESPFENNLNQRFLFLSKNHKEVLSALFYFVKEKKGLALVCGEVGTGKTMLVSSLLTLLPAQVHPITIPNPFVGYVELVQVIADALEITYRKENILELISQMKEVLIAARQQGKTYLLIADEAQLLSDENLEQVRLLSNIEIPEGKLLQILLVGQLELSQKLNRHGMRQLRQRININRFLFPMDQAETLAYLDHRLRAVGSSFQACFEEPCAGMVYTLSGGVPRNINHLCDNALLICMTEGLKKVNSQVLMEAREALQSDTLFAPQVFPAETVGTRRGGISWLSVAYCLAFLLLGFVLGHSVLVGQYLKGRSVADLWPILSSISLEAQSSASRQLTTSGEGIENRRLATSQNKSPDQQEHPKTHTEPMLSGGEVSSPESKGGEPLPQKNTDVFEKNRSPSQEAAPTLPAVPESQEKEERSRASSEIYRETMSPKALAPKASSLPPQEQQVSEIVNPPAPAAQVTHAANPREVSPQAPEPETAGSPPPEPADSGNKPVTLRTHQVTDEDGNLSRIVSKYYQDDKKLALAAILLANPQIPSENLIYVGQSLTLPEVDKSVISLADKKHYALYNQYADEAHLKQAVERLTKNQVRFVIRETQEPGWRKDYRIFIGGYEQEADLQRARTIAEGE